MSKADLDRLLNEPLWVPSFGGGCVIPVTVPYCLPLEAMASRTLRGYADELSSTYFTYFLKTKVSRNSFPFLIFCTLQHHQKPDHDLPDPKCQFVPLDGDQYHLLISETTRSPISKHMFFLYPSKHEWQEAGIISISSLFSGKVYFLRK